jgi:hypothetical protein
LVNALAADAARHTSGIEGHDFAMSASEAMIRKRFGVIIKKYRDRFRQTV